MKKLTLFLIAGLLTFSITAQNTSPRFGTKPSDGNTGASLNYGQTLKALANTDSIAPGYFNSFFKFDTLKAAKAITIKTNNARAWDKAHLEFICDSLTAGRVITFTTTTGGKTVVATTTSGNTVTVKKQKKVLITFRFDGVMWMEESRSIQF